MSRWMIVLLALLVGATAKAAVPETPQLRLIGVADGLPSSTITGLALDRAGYLWLATTDGLARYDGVGMRVWRHVPGDPASLPGNYLNAVHVDAEDRVWVAIEGRGLSVLAADRRAFRHYRKTADPRMGSDDVWAIASRDGELWFGTFGGGLHRLSGIADGGDGRITRFMPVPGDPRSLPDDIVLSLGFDAGGRLWIGTTAGLARWTGSDFERLVLPGDQPAPMVYSVSPDGAALWLGASSGLFRREADGRWTRPDWSPMFAAPNAVFGVMPDRDGQYWIASQRNLWRVGTDTVPAPVPIGAHGPVLPMYQMLRQDNGALWFPVAGVGLGYLRSDWRRIAQYSRADNALAGELYRGVAAAADGGVWLAGSRGELELIEADGELRPAGARVRARLEGRKPMSIVEDRQGRVWIGERRSLIRVDRGGEVREWREGGVDGVLGGPVDRLALAPDGSLWLSCAGAGIQQRDPATGKVLATILAGPGQGLGVGDIEAMAFDANGDLWIAGEDGLARWDSAAERFSPVPGIATGDRVFAFAFEPDASALWLQRLSGLERHARAGEAWRLVDRVGAVEGIPSVEGSGLLIDARGQVWLPSLRGLFRWDPRSRHVRRFGLPDGLSSQEFVDRAVTLTADGKLAAALADGGVVLVDTLAPDPAPVRPALHWDRVEVRRDGGWAALDTTALSLSPQDRELRVQLRLLAFDDAQANRYFTRLDGYDRDWVEQGASGERVLAGLPAGRHVLRARAVDAAGNAATGQLLHFTVQPPWWRTPWARTGFAASAILLAWWLAHAYRRQLRRRLAWQRAEHERELSRAASLAKTRFLATLGHEVRTPMTGVLGMSELLLGTRLDAQQRGYTESIRRAGEHLLRLVNDALDLARIESGKLELSRQPFDLRALVDEVAALIGPLARQRGLAFGVDIAANAPRRVHGDPVRVRQILLNLLGNAIKFTERGAVTLRLATWSAPALPATDAEAMTDDAAGPGASGEQRTSDDGLAESMSPGEGVLLEVGDTGPGLDEEQQSRLFRRFEQAEGSRTAARYGGSGLGLAICQELALAMGGRISVASAPGAGARFSVVLPLPAVAGPALAPAEATPAPGPLALLLVEDDPTVAEVIAGLLRAQGHRVSHAGHGLAALAESVTAPFDAALLDLDLPGLDGFALARQLRAQGFVQPLIAITARADAEAEPQARAAGFDRFIRKPVTGAMLADLVGSVMSDPPFRTREVGCGGVHTP